MQIPALVTDSPSADGGGEFRGFIEHRHDQSLFSLLIKKRLRQDHGKPHAVVIRDAVTWVGHHKITRAAYKWGPKGWERHPTHAIF